MAYSELVKVGVPGNALVTLGKSTKYIVSLTQIRRRSGLLGDGLILRQSPQ
jgi:hypothetical protein